MKAGLFKFDVVSEVAKIKSIPANPANSANLDNDNDGLNVQISKISRISNDDIGNSKNEDLERLVDRASELYQYSDEDILEIKTAAKNNQEMVVNALVNQIEDIELLEAGHVSWQEIPNELRRLIDKLCENSLYLSCKNELLAQMDKMSVARMLREIKSLKQELRL